MNLIEMFQDLVAQVPALLQPIIVAAAGAVPFIEGEGAAAIGILGGINPVVAAIAAIVGNFLCVLVVVIASSGARKAIVNRVNRRTAPSQGVPMAASGAVASEAGVMISSDFDQDASPREKKFQRALLRYGVPGVCLLGPLLLPTQFTASMLAAAGVDKQRILIWQAAAIVGWTALLTILIGGALSSVV